MHEMKNDRLRPLQCTSIPAITRKPKLRSAPYACVERMHKELIMLAPFTSEPVALAARSVHRVESAKGLEIACVRGAIWVTQERDQRDWVLMAGQSVVLERPGLAVVYAFKDALITVSAAWRLPAGGHAQPRRPVERGRGHPRPALRPAPRQRRPDPSPPPLYRPPP